MEAQAIAGGKFDYNPKTDLLGGMLKQRTKTKNRPLIFVAHSLGGIVVKKVVSDSPYRLP